MPAHHQPIMSLQTTILSLSVRISRSSPPIKPFIRFAKVNDHDFVPRRFWDFEYELQKRLLACLYQIATADEIVNLCKDQWQHNLQALLTSNRYLLRDAQHKGSYPRHFDTLKTRFQTLLKTLRPGERMLYIGAGSGAECLQLAGQGLHIVGIDTITPLLIMARDWAELLQRDAVFAGMDLMDMGFEAESFDSFFLEFYGSWPTQTQISRVQHELARILKIGGRGFISAARKKYLSYWFLMGGSYSYPVVMQDWLRPQAALDFLFSDADGSEERLMLGLYNRSHTVPSLTDELSWTFEVVDCQEDRDPRYLMAEVRRRPDLDLPRSDSTKAGEWAAPDMTPAALAYVDKVVDQIEHLTAYLEQHTDQVIEYFANHSDPRHCLKTIKPDLAELVTMLEAIFQIG